ncbi:MAG: alpha-amylase family glycosyl hydrolase [Propionibacteriaceae bacterium]
MTSLPTPATSDWWRSAVVYQVYPRSFADADRNGTGDVRGIIDKLGYLQALGIDAIWVSPWYPSPLADGGYDVSDYRDIHPDFGTLSEADEFIAAAHALGMRILIDLVPNHSSDQHPWFQAALAAGPGSPERDRYIFRDGTGDDGEQPPNNWPAMFGGSAWERVVDADGRPEQWYLHLFAPEQPDWNWDNEAVVEEFDAILRFWFDRGVDGFRIDVADSMAKDPALPDLPLDDRTGSATREKYEGQPFFDQPHVHDILRRWRKIADTYADSPEGPRVFVSEAWLSPAERLARYVRSDELHTTFNFDALACEWKADSLRHVIDATTTAMGEVGAPCTWVLANHDTVRVVTRYGKSVSGTRYTPTGIDPGGPSLFEDLSAQPTDVALGRRRARAAALLELALPGGAYVYQGDELGLEEVEDLPDDVLQDPTWLRSGHTVRGRDGCRVPIPWSGDHAPFGFGGPGGQPWLPQPEHWGPLTAAAQDGDPASTLSLYRSALAERRANAALGDGTLTWDEDAPAEVLSFTREPGFRCIVNLSDSPVEIPAGAEIILASAPVTEASVATDVAVWLRL